MVTSPYTCRRQPATTCIFFLRKATIISWSSRWQNKVRSCFQWSQQPDSALSQLNRIQVSVSYSLRSIVVLSCHLVLGLANGYFPLGFPNKRLYIYIYFFNSPTHLSVCIQNYTWIHIILVFIYGIYICANSYLYNAIYMLKQITHFLNKIISSPILFILFEGFSLLSAGVWCCAN